MLAQLKVARKGYGDNTGTCHSMGRVWTFANTPPRPCSPTEQWPNTHTLRTRQPTNAPAHRLSHSQMFIPNV